MQDQPIPGGDAIVDMEVDKPTEVYKPSKVSNRHRSQSEQSLHNWTASPTPRRFTWRTTRTKKKNNEWRQS
eukprot:4489385-Amphidinium_carterae.1